MPESVHTKTRRIAKNTVLLYLRSLISLFISLYTSRLVLKALGVDDFGIYGVVGSFVSMFSIVSGSLSGAISRFINFSMGKGDKEDLSNTFAQSLNIMIILSLIVLVLTETFGLWFLYNRMNITQGRETAAFWCFQLSVFSSISSFLIVPFTGSIIAHERMGVFAYIDVGEVIIKFLIALLLTFSLGDIDKLILYVGLMLLVTLTKQIISRIYAVKHFEECHIRWYWSKKKFLEMFSYAGWSFLGKTSGTFAGQGVTMIVNVVFGPTVNAARALSSTVNHSLSIFVNNFTTAINPQITQSYASGDHEYLNSLLYRGTKFSFFIMWIAALPLLLETSFIVKLWLGTYPDYTVVFIRIALISNIISIFQVILAMGIRATGRITWYQLSFSFLEFLQFGLAYILLHRGFSPEWCYYCGLITSLLKVPTMWLLSKKQINFHLSDFLRIVVLPLLLVIILSAIIPFCIHHLFSFGWTRFLLVLLSSSLISSLCFFYVGCTSQERKFIFSLLLQKFKISQTMDNK